MSLQKFLLLARLQLDELSVQNVKEIRLIGAANEGKNELVKIIRRAKEDFFESYTVLTIPIASALDPSEIDLPSDFAVLKDLQCKSTGYENVQFFPCDRADPRFRNLVVNQRFNSNYGYFLYDVASKASPYPQVAVLKLAPGSDIELDLKVVYNTNVADMVLPTDEPAAIPAEHWDYIVTWMVCDALRTKNDPRYTIFKEKLDTQEGHVAGTLQPRQVRDPTYVRGFMEDDWGFDAGHV